MKPKVVIFDLEIEKAIPDRSGIRLDGIQYCAGWSDYAMMGISCLCAYDIANELPLVYCADNLSDFQSLINRADWLVGFNNARFDNRVLACNGIEVPESKTVDLLAEIWKANGLDPDDFNFTTHGGYGLDAVCAVNFGAGKAGDGALAPVEWQRGQIGKVISYCLSDVQLTTRLWREIVQAGEVVNPKTGLTMAVSLSQFNELARQEV